MKKDTFLGKIIAVGKTFGGARPKFDGLMSRTIGNQEQLIYRGTPALI